MKSLKYIVFVVFCFVFGCQTNETTNQNRNQPDTIFNYAYAEDDGGTRCAFKRTEKKPESTFPFNKSDKIELVSYGAKLNLHSDNELIRDGKFMVKEIKQRVTLNKAQTDSLFSILYNFEKIKKGSEEPLADCYNPRHCIVFYQDGRAISFLEICFDCRKRRMPENLDFGESCDEKWCLLQNFFKVNKADFGLIEEICQ